MKIRAIHTCPQNKSIPSFKAKDFATVLTIAGKTKETLKLYELEYADRTLLEKMSANIDLKKLFSQKKFLTKQLQSWHNIIDNAILMSGFSNPEQAFLAVKNNKPCGIITFQSLPTKEIYLDNLATWPVSKDKKVRFAGQVLVNALFNEAEKCGVKTITLDLCKNLKDLSLSFYEKLGFSNKQQINETLSISAQDYKKSLNHLKDSIQITENPNKSNINLENVLDIRSI